MTDLSDFELFERDYSNIKDAYLVVTDLPEYPSAELYTSQLKERCTDEDELQFALECARDYVDKRRTGEVIEYVDYLGMIYALSGEELCLNGTRYKLAETHRG